MAKCSKLTRFDDSNSQVQRFIGDDEECYFIGDYTMERGWNYSENNSFNSFILNLKKPKTASSTELRYKNDAINGASRCLDHALNLNAFIDSATLIPMPSSNQDNDPNYDDRIIRVCEGLKKFNAKISVIDLLHTPVSRPALHKNKEGKRDPDQIQKTIAIRENHDEPNDTIILLDDVITTGASYLAAKRIIIDVYPDKKVNGIFLARSIPPNPFEDF